jgi:hypothetical protein
LVVSPVAPSFDYERVIIICQDLSNKLRKVSEFERNNVLEQLLIMAADINKRLEFMTREANIGAIKLNEQLDNIDTQIRVMQIKMRATDINSFTRSINSNEVHT